MSDDDNNKYKISGYSFFSILLFLAFCNVYQPNVALGALTITTIFMSIVWTIVFGLAIVGILLVVLGLIGLLIS